MRIAVKLVSLDGRRPAGFDDDGDGWVELGPRATLADALDLLGLPADEPYAALVNGEPVAAADRAGRRLAPGDALTVFPPIKGGRP